MKTQSTFVILLRSKYDRSDIKYFFDDINRRGCQEHPQTGSSDFLKLYFRIYLLSQHKISIEMPKT